MSGVKDTQVGFTRNGEKILGFSPLRFEDRFYVEQKLFNGHTICVVMTKKEVGEKAAQVYSNSKDKVNLQDFRHRCYRKDAERCVDIIHIACKKVESKKLNRSKYESNEQRMPPTKVLLYFDEQETWMNWSDLVDMQGRKEAKYLIQSYYDIRGVSYSWNEELEEMMMAVKIKKM